MSCLSFNIEGYSLELVTFFMLAAPATLYAMGMMERGGRWFVGAGLVVHIGSMLQRYGVTCILPLAEKHDNISFMAFVMALTFFVISKDRKLMRETAISVLPLAAAFMMVAAAHRTVDEITPFMATPWFFMHVFFYFSAYGLLGVSACLGVHYIIARDERHEALQYRLAAYAWAALTLSVVCGSVWFFLAYGNYWLWTSKELWITITWMALGTYLHMRLVRGMRGRAAAIVGIACFVLALFTYFGVGRIIPAPPAQF